MANHIQAPFAPAAVGPRPFGEQLPVVSLFEVLPLEPLSSMGACLVLHGAVRGTPPLDTIRERGEGCLGSRAV